MKIKNLPPLPNLDLLSEIKSSPEFYEELVKELKNEMAKEIEKNLRLEAALQEAKAALEICLSWIPKSEGYSKTGQDKIEEAIAKIEEALK